MDLNSWPLSANQKSETWDQSSWNVDNTLIRSKTLGFDALFTFRIVADPRGTGENIIFMHTSGLLGGYKEYYSTPDKKESYIKYIEKVLSNIYGNFILFSNYMLGYYAD